MNLINLQNDKPVHLTLAKDRVRSLKRGHPWLFPEVLRDLPKAPPGSLALVKDKDGEILAKGYYDGDSKLAFRAFTVSKERLDEKLIESRLARALDLRRRLFADRSLTNAYRLVNGEGDGLPGLVCDVYNDAAVIKLDGAGAQRFYNVDGIASWLSQRLGFPLRTCFYKFKAGDKEGRGKLISGEFPSQPVVFLENSATFQADIVQGQKTGFFLDQRDNRARLGRFCKGKRVLNVFGYTGGFSIYAGRNSAAHVTTVDLAKPALEFAEANWHLNGLDEQCHSAVAADAFQFLEAALKERQRWDVVVVDPPSFAPNKASVEKARASYERIFTLAAQVTREGGILALASCSSHIPSAMFSEVCEDAICTRARRQGYMLGSYGQPEDHPFPIACEELRYLKFNIYILEN